jgi:pimeloyl-ACP methyl ester carboxylesterase
VLAPPAKILTRWQISRVAMPRRVRAVIDFVLDLREAVAANAAAWVRVYLRHCPGVTMAPKKIVFIHGMYMTPACWEPWTNRFGAKGYDCLAPAWPGRDRPVAVLRRSASDPKLAALTLTAVLEHLSGAIRALDQKPILIGHSMGGLITQLLLQRELAAAAVAIDSAPPQGVFTIKWSFIKANWGHINPFASKDLPATMTFEQFRYAFVNALPLTEQRAAFEAFVVPESRRVPAESLTSTARIDFRKPGAPLLMIAGSQDHIIPPSLNRSNFAKYRRPESITEFKEFPGRTHFIIGQSGWEEVADHVSSWLDRVLR